MRVFATMWGKRRIKLFSYNASALADLGSVSVCSTLSRRHYLNVSSSPNVTLYEVVMSVGIPILSPFQSYANN